MSCRDLKPTLPEYKQECQPLDHDIRLNETWIKTFVTHLILNFQYHTLPLHETCDIMPMFQSISMSVIVNMKIYFLENYRHVSKLSSFQLSSVLVKWWSCPNCYQASSHEDVWRCGVQLHTFLILTLHWGAWSSLHPVHFTPGVTYCTESWVGARAGLDAVHKTKISCFCRK